jgi:hypothetical protein
VFSSLGPPQAAPKAKAPAGPVDTTVLHVCFCLLSAAVCCLLSAVCCLLSAIRCLLSAIRCLLSAVCCLPMTRQFFSALTPLPSSFCSQLQQFSLIFFDSLLLNMLLVLVQRRPLQAPRDNRATLEHRIGTGVGGHDSDRNSVTTV